jgi:hypothetical protein
MPKTTRLIARIEAATERHRLLREQKAMERVSRNQVSQAQFGVFKMLLAWIDQSLLQHKH